MSEVEMKYARVTVSMPEELLSEVDARASDEGVSRSFLIQEASARYLDEKRKAWSDEERRRSIQAAIEGFKRVRQMPLLDPRPTIELIRELREHDDLIEDE